MGLCALSGRHDWYWPLLFPQTEKFIAVYSRGPQSWTVAHLVKRRSFRHERMDADGTSRVCLSSRFVRFLDSVRINSGDLGQLGTDR